MREEKVKKKILQANSTLKNLGINFNKFYFNVIAKFYCVLSYKIFQNK